MSRGLGTMQRMMLNLMAGWELRRAEEATQDQQPYHPPRPWSLAAVLFSLRHSGLDEAINERQRAEHERNRQFIEAVKAGNTGALQLFNIHLAIYQQTQKPRPEWFEKLDVGAFRPDDARREDFERFNPTRAMKGLVSRGLVCKHEGQRRDALALTRDGFQMARRLSNLDSEFVDLDTLQDCWPDDLSFHATDRTWKHGGREPWPWMDFARKQIVD